MSDNQMNNGPKNKENIAPHAFNRNSNKTNHNDMAPLSERKSAQKDSQNEDEMLSLELLLSLLKLNEHKYALPMPFDENEAFDEEKFFAEYEEKEKQPIPRTKKSKRDHHFQEDDLPQALKMLCLEEKPKKEKLAPSLKSKREAINDENPRLEKKRLMEKSLKTKRNILEIDENPRAHKAVHIEFTLEEKLKNVICLPSSKRKQLPLIEKPLKKLFFSPLLSKKRQLLQNEKNANHEEEPENNIISLKRKRNILQSDKNPRLLKKLRII